MKTTAKIPEVLYHYTSLDALINGIIQSDGVQFRCSHYGYLNDPNEMHIGNNFINKLLSEAKINHPLTMSDAYILSFSQNKDYMPMWNMYGKGGKGVMLEINTSSLLNVCPNVEHCLYCNKKGELTGSSKLERINELVESLKEAYNTYPPRVMTALTSHILLSRICGMVKSSDFEYENEVRAIFEQKDFEISYYLRHNIIVPYITISLPKDAIRSIWIGPTQDKDRTKMSLDKFLNSQGYNLDIEVSEIDYRDDSNN